MKHTLDELLKVSEYDYPWVKKWEGTREALEALLLEVKADEAADLAVAIRTAKRRVW